jgi:hypothetical protein
MRTGYKGNQGNIYMRFPTYIRKESIGPGQAATFLPDQKINRRIKLI